MASLVDVYNDHVGCPLPQNPLLHPRAPGTAFPWICINMSLIVVVRYHQRK
jgi:hypothetical protein